MGALLPILGSIGAAVGYAFIAESHVATGGLSGPLCPRGIEGLLAVDAVVGVALLGSVLLRASQKGDGGRDDPGAAKKWVLQCSVFRFLRMAATLLTPMHVGGFADGAAIPDLVRQVAPGLAAVAGLYDLIVPHEQLWDHRRGLPAALQFAAALGKGMLILDINRMLGFYFVLGGRMVFLGWSGFVLFSYVYSTHFMLRIGRSYTYALMMVSGCAGMAVAGDASDVPLSVSSLAGALSIGVVVYYLLFAQKEDQAAAGKSAAARRPLIATEPKQ